MTSKQEYISDLAKLKRAIKQSKSPENQIFYQQMIEIRESWILNKKEKKKMEKRETREERHMRLALKCKRVQRVCEGLHLWL